MDEPDGGQFGVLVVCLGNVCRSPLAERVLRLRLSELLGEGAGLVQIRSAGVRALVGHPMDETSAAELLRLGGTPQGAASTQVTQRMVTDADLVLTATRALRGRLLEDSPRALKRSFTIREFAALTAHETLRDQPPEDARELVARAAEWRSAAEVDDYDVPDPIGAPAEVHREVADLLDDSCTTIARALAGALRPGVQPA